MVIEEEEKKRKIEEDKLELKKKKGRRRLDSDFVHLDRRRRKRQVFVAEQLQSRPPSAAVMHASSKSPVSEKRDSLPEASILN